MDTSLNMEDCDIVLNFTSRIYRASAVHKKLLWNDTDQLLYRVILPIIAVTGILANLAFLFTIIRVKRMQTTTNYYLANLAVADILYLLIQMSARLHSFTHSPFRENMPYTSRHGCWGGVFPIFISYFASVELVTLVSLERYYSICKPVYHRLMRGKQHTIRLIIIAWIVAVVLAAITVPLYGKMRRRCFIWPEGDKFRQLPATFQTCYTVSVGYGLFSEITRSLIFLIALGISCFAYFKLVRALGNLKLNKSPSFKNTTAASSKNKGNIIRNQVARLLIINGAIFFMCQFPSRYISMDRYINGAYFSKRQPFVLFIISFILLLINSAVNPFIYGLSSRLYRVAFCHAFGIAKFFDMERLSSHNDSFRDTMRSSLRTTESLKRKQGSSSTLDTIDNIDMQPIPKVVVTDDSKNGKKGKYF